MGTFGYYRRRILCIYLIKDGLKNGFKDKELNKTGCISILVAVVGLLVLVSMCSH
jgi:hypothetical protein